MNARDSYKLAWRMAREYDRHMDWWLRQEPGSFEEKVGRNAVANISTMAEERGVLPLMWRCYDGIKARRTPLQNVAGGKYKRAQRCGPLARYALKTPLADRRQKLGIVRIK